jgi:hypothetical protein
MRCGYSLDAHEKAPKCDLYASNRGKALGSLVSVKRLCETHLTQNCQFKVLSIVQLWLSVASLLDGCST